MNSMPNGAGGWPDSPIQPSPPPTPEDWGARWPGRCLVIIRLWRNWLNASEGSRNRRGHSMRPSLRSTLACCLLAGLASLSGQAQQRESPSNTQGSSPPINPSREEDRQALAELLARFTEAYNASDASALSALFTEDAEIVGDDGTVTEGRTAIAERFAATFAEDPDARITIEPLSIRFLTADSAWEKGVARLSRGPGETPEVTEYSVLYVRRDGKWLHAIIRDEPAVPATHHEQLRRLEWMVGEWFNESDDAVVSTTCRWTDDGNFLVREFDVRIVGEVALRGTQRIGWDPLLGQFRTWVFDSEGGFAEGLMSSDGSQWLVKSTGVRPDGQAVTATTIITPLDADRVAWQVSDRTVGGEALPDIDQFILVRKPPAPTP